MYLGKSRKASWRNHIRSVNKHTCFGIAGGEGWGGVVENAFQTEGTVEVNAYKKSIF